MQSLAWRGAGKSDYLGRAEGLLQRELETRENDLMRGTIPAYNKICVDKDGNDIVSGNNINCTDPRNIFTISTTTTPGTISNTFLVNVKITWPGSVNGITNSMIVSNQTAFQ